MMPAAAGGGPALLRHGAALRDDHGRRDLVATLRPRQPAVTLAAAEAGKRATTSPGRRGHRQDRHPARRQAGSLPGHGDGDLARDRPKVGDRRVQGAGAEPAGRDELRETSRRDDEDLVQGSSDPVTIAPRPTPGKTKTLLA